ncbi:MAG TPA: hypothetical protein VF707_14630 [Ardenticatenaceae bacterium]
MAGIGLLSALGVGGLVHSLDDWRQLRPVAMVVTFEMVFLVLLSRVMALS